MFKSNFIESSPLGKLNAFSDLSLKEIILLQSCEKHPYCAGLRKKGNLSSYNAASVDKAQHITSVNECPTVFYLK